MKQVVDICAKNAVSGDAVLLSPGVSGECSITTNREEEYSRILSIICKKAVLYAGE